MYFWTDDSIYRAYTGVLPAYCLWKRTEPTGASVSGLCIRGDGGFRMVPPDQPWTWAGQWESLLLFRQQQACFWGVGFLLIMDKVLSSSSWKWRIWRPKIGFKKNNNACPCSNTSQHSWGAVCRSSFCRGDGGNDTVTPWQEPLLWPLALPFHSLREPLFPCTKRREISGKSSPLGAASAFIVEPRRRYTSSGIADQPHTLSPCFCSRSYDLWLWKNWYRQMRENTAMWEPLRSR